MDREKKIRIADTVNDSIVDGPGLRLAIFVQGCPHNCPGCHNPQTHDFKGGREITLGELYDMAAGNPLLSGVTFSGGEPFCQAKPLAELGAAVKEMGLNVVTYSGYTYEYLLSHGNEDNGWGELLAVSDYLVDGEYVQALRDLTLKFRGSSNQRIIDLGRTRETGTLTVIDER